MHQLLKRFNFILGLLFSLLAQTTCAQDDQIWLEYMLNYPFANSFNLENAIVYSTNLSADKWRSLGYTATVQYSLNQHFELQSAIGFSYTNQTQTYNTIELRPMLGTKIYFTPNKRIQTRLLVRYEMRNLEDLETQDWGTTWRPRLRAETLTPINRNSIHKDKVWYAILDFEYLYTSSDVQERFANRSRLRMGIGYRLNYNSRFEFVYMIQNSRNQIEDNFYKVDNIFRFRLKHYLRKTVPSKADGWVE